MDDIDRRLVNALQGGFPLTQAPFDDAGSSLGLSGTQLMARVARLLGDGTLSRFGPLFQIERMGGVFLLAAMEVPAERFDAVAALVNARPEVAHNYERDHRLNMWFVVAAESQSAVDATVTELEAQTGLPIYGFPKEREYFVGMELAA